ncbi:MAG: hypothetical protein ACT4PO_09685, partial [Actinomycetota bacterium]
MLRRRVLVVLSILSLVSLSLALAPSAEAVVPGKPGKIAFQRIADGINAEIFLMKADGSNQVNITNHP